MRRRLLALALVVLGCGDDAPPDDPDAGGVDAGDASADAGPPPFEPDPPAAPAPPASPEMTPCPAGWREVDAGGVTICDPWPEGGRSPCVGATAQFPGDPACGALGTPCPAGEWPEGLPEGVPILYVRAGGAAGGSGTMDAPYGTLEEARAAATPGSVLALGKGTFLESISVTTDLTLWGACVAETIIQGDFGAFSGVVDAAAGNVTVKNLQITGLRTGLSAQAGARADVQDVLIAGASYRGIAVEAAGAVITGRNVVVRDVLGGPGTLGRGIMVSLGGSVALTRAIIEGARDVAVSVYDEGSSLSFEDSSVQDTLGDRGFDGRGVDALLGGHVSLVRTVLSANRDTALFAAGPGAEAILEDVVIEDTQSLELDLFFGRGMDVQEEARADLRRVAFLRNRDVGLIATLTPNVVAEDVVVQGTLPAANDGSVGRGIAFEQSSGELRRVWIDDNRDLGILVAGSGSLVTLEDAVIRRTRGRESDGTFGYGLYVFDGGSLEVTRALIEESREGGIAAASAQLEAVDLEVRRTLGRDSDGLFGRGLSMQTGAVVRLERALFTANREAALSVQEPGTELYASDLRVQDTDGLLVARGLSVEGGALADIVRAVFERNREVTLVAAQPGTEARLEHVAVVDNLERRCAIDLCEGLGAGIGVGSYLEAHVVMSRFLVSRSALAGLQLARGGTVDLHEGEVSNNPIGVNVQTEGFDTTRLSDEVVYRDNGQNLDSQELPVPFEGE